MLVKLHLTVRLSFAGSKNMVSDLVGRKGVSKNKSNAKGLFRPKTSSQTSFLSSQGYYNLEKESEGPKGKGERKGGLLFIS